MGLVCCKNMQFKVRISNNYEELFVFNMALLIEGFYYTMYNR